MTRYVYFSPSGDGWWNLAADEYFLDTLSPDDFLLYFYINKRAVIIGRNQNPWQECRAETMEKDGVQLVRRITGGGAVYHDSGNLNFSFITGSQHYDLSRQMHLIVEALADFGIRAECSGRNDIVTADGRKFSGNAFCVRGNTHQHHGTLLIRSDLSALQNYLNVSVDKLKAKGIKSVRSRVCNLSEYAPDLTCESVANALLQVCTAHMGAFKILQLSANAHTSIQKLYERHASWDWRMGKSPSFDYMLDHRFPWGGVQLGLNVKNGLIAEAKLYTDALDTTLSAAADVLPGLPFTAEAIGNACKSFSDHAPLADLGKYILENGLT